MRAILLLISFIFGSQALAVTKDEAKASLLQKARELIAQNSEIQKQKKQESFFINHPSFTYSSDIHTLRYHQTYIEKLPHNKRREWDVVDGQLLVHYYPNSDTYELENELVTLNMPFQSEQILDTDTLLKKTSSMLQARTALSEDDAKIQRKIIRDRFSKKFLPVYYVSMKSSSRNQVLQNKNRFTLVIDATTGDLLDQIGLMKRAEKKDIKISVFNGSLNTKVSDTDEVKNTQGNKELCQLLSKKSPDYLLVNINKCSEEPDEAVARAQKVIELIFNYYLENHDYYAMDNNRGKEQTINVLVHAGLQLDNAYWDPDLQIMAFGDGTGGTKVGESTLDYTHSIDISGHEYTHGIIDATAELSGPDESGALNEGYADIFGVLIERSSGLKTKNWIVGEDLYYKKSNTKKVLGLRALDNPQTLKTLMYDKNGDPIMVPYPATMSEKFAQGERCTEENDYCEVHANAYIWTHAFYNIIQEINSATSLSGAEIEKQMGKLYFLTLTHKIKTTETFLGAAKKTLKTCDSLYDPSICSIIKSQFQKSGLLAN